MLTMSDNKMHSKSQIYKLNPGEQKALAWAIEAAKAVKSGHNRNTEFIGFNQGVSMGSRMETAKKIDKHNFYKFKKGLECGEWKDTK